MSTWATNPTTSGAMSASNPSAAAATPGARSNSSASQASATSSQPSPAAMDQVEKDAGGRCRAAATPGTATSPTARANNPSPATARAGHQPNVPSDTAASAAPHNHN